MNVLKTVHSSAIALAGVLLACGSVHAAPACDSVSRVERNIVDRADDIDALRAYVWRTTIIYGIDMFEVRENLEKWQAAVDCRRQMAASDPADDIAAPTLVAQR